MRAIYSESSDNKIGHNNSLLFKSTEDMKHFKNSTLNTIVVMGNKTYESIGHPLSDRLNIVLTRNSNEKKKDEIPGTLLFMDFNSLTKFLSCTIKPVYAIGGVEVFNLLSNYNLITSIDSTRFEMDMPFANKKFVLGNETNFDILEFNKKLYVDVRVLQEDETFSEPETLTVYERVIHVFCKEKDYLQRCIFSLSIDNLMNKNKIIPFRSHFKFSEICSFKRAIHYILNEIFTHHDECKNPEYLREIIMILDNYYDAFKIHDTKKDDYMLTPLSIADYIKDTYL